MTHLSATEMINELNTTNMTQFEKTNSLVYVQPKNANQKRLSPWFGKRRYSKSIKVEKKPQEQDRAIHSDKTAQFLKKIFPRKRNNEPNHKTSFLYQQKPHQLIKNTVGETFEEEQENAESIIFLPIKPINFEKIKTTKIHSNTERKTESERKMINRVEPQIFQPPCLTKLTQNSQESPKSSSLAFTFRKSWKKKERVQTEPVQQITKKKRMSIDEIYHLIGKQRITNNYHHHYSFTMNQDLFEQKIKAHENSNSSWLVPRSKIKNHKSSKFKTFVCKTQYI